MTDKTTIDHYPNGYCLCCGAELIEGHMAACYFLPANQSTPNAQKFLADVRKHQKGEVS